MRFQKGIRAGLGEFLEGASVITNCVGLEGVRVRNESMVVFKRDNNNNNNTKPVRFLIVW